jgi:outer membrane protein assembly factor BamD (BamD/ComL family)
MSDKTRFKFDQRLFRNTNRRLFKKFLWHFPNNYFAAYVRAKLFFVKRFLKIRRIPWHE